MSRATMGSNARTRAAVRFAEWRSQGIPMQVTAHEAWRLSGGKIGREGDHGASGAYTLARVAQIVEGAR